MLSLCRGYSGGAGRDGGLGSAEVLERSSPGVKYLLISAQAASGLTSTISLRLAQEARGSISRGPGRRRTGSGGGRRRPTKARLWRRGWREGGTCVLGEVDRSTRGGGFADVADKNLSGLNDNGVGCGAPWSDYTPPPTITTKVGKTSGGKKIKKQWEKIRMYRAARSRR